MKQLIKAIGWHPMKLVSVSCSFDRKSVQSYRECVRSASFLIPLLFLLYIHIYVFILCKMVVCRLFSSWPAFGCRLGTQPISKGCHQIIMRVQTHMSDLIPFITLCASVRFFFFFFVRVSVQSRAIIFRTGYQRPAWNKISSKRHGIKYREIVSLN